MEENFLNFNENSNSIYDYNNSQIDFPIISTVDSYQNLLKNNAFLEGLFFKELKNNKFTN